MIGVIPNPTKKITIDFPLEQVKTGVKRIPSLLKKYKMFKTNEAFNVYTLEASEFLSMGVYIDVNLTSVADTRTEFNIEIKRKIGSFDQWVEVQKANEHIDNLITGLSKALTASPEELEEVAVVEVKNTQPERILNTGGKIFSFVLWILISGIVGNIITGTAFSVFVIGWVLIGWLIPVKISMMINALSKPNPKYVG